MRRWSEAIVFLSTPLFCDKYYFRTDLWHLDTDMEVSQRATIGLVPAPGKARWVIPKVQQTNI
jgi:hypothetical protein